MNIEEEQAIEMLEFIKEHNSLIGYKLRNRECLTEFILNELDKKDKQIRLMADILQDNLYFSPLDGLNKEELIEYFYKKAEEK